VAPVPGSSGREKPWRPASSLQDLTAPGPDPEDELAAAAGASGRSDGAARAVIPGAAAGLHT